MRSLGLGISVISLLMTSAVVGNAYFQKKQFYPSVVYITKSNPSMAVIYIQSLVLVLMMGKLMRKIFLGTLRAAEFEHFMERFWYALTETCLAFTVFRDDFNPKFVALFTVLLFLKSFHWLAEDRIDYMERSPVIGWLFHIRASALLTVLALSDYLLILHAYDSTITKGATVQLVFGFEYAILITMVANITIKYALHAAELRADTPWDNKVVFLLYTELVIGLIRVVLYVFFVCIMVRIYTLPLFAFRPMYYTMRNFKKALNDVILSRRAIRNMNTLYPDATPEELTLSDNICIICREDMVNNSKKLPCGHIFHMACLRSWFQRQQTCPTCRLNILRSTATNPPRNAAGTSAATPAATTAAATGTAAQQPNNRGNLDGGANPQIGGANPNIFQFGVNNPFGNLLPQNTLPFVPGTGEPPLIPPFPFLSPYGLPAPPIPPSLDTLTDDEIRILEGNERKHVEERIKLLRNIQILMDASVVLMNQYTAITAKLPPVDTQTETPIATTSNIAETIKPDNIPEIPSTSTGAEMQNKTTTQDESVTVLSTSSSSLSSSPLSGCSHRKTAGDNEKVKIEDIGNEENDSLLRSSSNEDTTDSLTKTELRRRRLQRFLQDEQN